MDITGLNFLDFVDSSGLGPQSGDVLEFTAEAGKIYTVHIGGREAEVGMALMPATQLSSGPNPVWLFGSAMAGLMDISRRKKIIA